MRDVLVIVAAYALGSVPFAMLVLRRRGVDLRRVGSGNVGASNVLRLVGARRAAAVLALDGVKGAVAVLLAARLAGGATPVVAGLASIVGHVFPLWLGFRGGKGVATSAGVFAVLAPSALAVAAGAFVATVWATRYISVGSLVGAVALVLVTAFSAPAGVATAATVAAVVVLSRHRDNVARLLAGTERRIGLRLPLPSISSKRVD
jgi:glycerol-3-phosphate acyltransferase PlsY